MIAGLNLLELDDRVMADAAEVPRIGNTGVGIAEASSKDETSAPNPLAQAAVGSINVLLVVGGSQTNGALCG